MNLVLDIGHRRIKWALFDQSKKNISGAFIWQLDDEAFDKAWAEIGIPSAVMACNVAGEAIAKKCELWMQQRWHLMPQWLTIGDGRHGLSSSYDDVSELGTDRWAAALGVRSISRQPAIIIDCGSAITVDAIDDQGMFHANAILPGRALQISTLASLIHSNRQAEDLHQQEVCSPASSTQQGIANGVLIGITGAIDRLIEHAQFYLTRQAVIYLTGGDAEVLIPLLETAVSHEPDLVLLGLLYELG